MKFYKNNALTKENNFYILGGDYVYNIHLDGDENNILLGQVYQDSIYSWYYPFK